MSLVLGILLLFLIVAALVLWFFVMPRISNGADLSTLRLNYAQRGLWDARLPQSSIEAIALASRLGYGVKLEIFLSRDRRLMAVGKRQIPLSDILAAVDGTTPLMLEIASKTTDLGLCLRLARMLDAYGGAFSVISRDPKTLSWFKNYRPGFARGLILAPESDFATAHLLKNHLARPDFLVVEKTQRKHLNILVLTKIFRLTCFVYPIDSQEDHLACRRQKQYTIFTKIHPKERHKEGKRNGQFYL